jgi:hypothetical protein
MRLRANGQAAARALRPHQLVMQLVVMAVAVPECVDCQADEQTD